MKARRLIATAAPKGGVGKTTVQKLLFDLLPEHGRRVVAWDLDFATGTFADYDDGIKTFDARGKRSSRSWIDDCYRDDVDDVLLDVPGGRIDDLVDTFADGNAEALVTAVTESDRRFVLVNPIGVMVAEVLTAQMTLNLFGDTEARLVVLKNGRFGDKEDFIIYDGLEHNGQMRYGATRQLAEHCGAETIFMPALAPKLMAQVDAERLRLIDAAGPAGIATLGRLNAMRVRLYLSSIVEAWRGSSLDLGGEIPQRRAARS